MRSLILSLVAVLGLVASADAHGGLAIRRTPLRPFVGPVVVRQNFAFHHRQAFIAPRFHAQAFVQPLYAQQFVAPVYQQQFVAPQAFYGVQQQFVVPQAYGVQQFNAGGCAACFR